MIHSVTVTNARGEDLVLELKYPERSGYYLLSMDGLGPTKADINTVTSLTNDGTIYNSARANQRNITMMLAFLESPTIEETRQRSYKYFPIKGRIVLTFQTGVRRTKIVGYVESNEPVIFAKMEATNISIICPDPHFYSVDKTITIFSGLQNGFTFPFSNNSLVNSLLVFGSIINLNEQTVFYGGDTPVGVVIDIHISGPVGDLSIYSSNTRQIMKILEAKLISLTGSGLVAGDDIEITTIVGRKSIFLTRDGERINILSCIGRNSSWFQLVPGDNIFGFTTASPMANVQLRIENSTLYEGL